MSFEQLGDQVDEQSSETAAALAIILLQLRSQLISGQEGEALLRAERALRVAAYDGFTLGAQTQLAELRAVTAADLQTISKLAEQHALQAGLALTVNTSRVIAGSTEAVTTAYAGLLANFGSLSALRAGIRMGALELAGPGAEPTLKQFIRVRGSKEPRSHSGYEGTTRRIDGTWRIAGIDVQAPGDPKLPISETIRCGHAVKYLRGES